MNFDPNTGGEDIPRPALNIIAGVAFLVLAAILGAVIFSIDWPPGTFWLFAVPFCLFGLLVLAGVRSLRRSR